MHGFRFPATIGCPVGRSWGPCGPAGLLVSPPWDTPVPPATTLYYVARHRIDPHHLTPRR